MGNSLGSRAAAGVLALVLAGAPWSAGASPSTSPDARTQAAAARAELRALIGELEGAARAADDAAQRWLAANIHAMEARADDAAQRWLAANIHAMEARADEQASQERFEERVRGAYIAGPGRAVEMVLGATDLHELAARLPFVTTALDVQRLDVREVAARRRGVEDALTDAEDAQRRLGAAEERLALLRGAIEARLAKATAAALIDVEDLKKRYEGTVDRVSGATHTIRRQRGEAMFAAAAPYLGPRADCSIPHGLRSTGDTISGGASWYGDAFRGKPTASGAIFDPDRYTVAHRTLPFGLFLLIRFRDRCVVSFLNDRGPYVDGRILDLSHASAQAVGLTGVHDVSATLLVRASG